MEIKVTILLELLHVMNYAKGFNELNAKLDAIQTRHFSEVGLDVLMIRDPFVLYEEHAQLEKKALALCGVDSIKSLYKNKELWSSDATVDVDLTDFPLFNIAYQAITLYNERTTFFMLDHSYQDDIIKHLGESKGRALIADLHEILGKEMVCGNADRGESTLRDFLSNNGKSYTQPPAPYLEKDTARFAEFREQIRLSAEQRKREKSSI